MGSLSRADADTAMMKSLEAFLEPNLDPGMRLRVFMLRALVASRMKPFEAALGWFRSRDAELDEVIALASRPSPFGTVNPTVYQQVVRCLHMSGMLRRVVDMSGWRPSRAWAPGMHERERDALIADLAAELYSGLLSLGR